MPAPIQIFLHIVSTGQLKVGDPIAAMDFFFGFDANTDATVGPDLVATRVCDRCIQRRVKCDRGRPSCSRCAETAWPCIYSVEKKRPGPAKGSRKRPRPQHIRQPSDSKPPPYLTPASSLSSGTLPKQPLPVASAAGPADSTRNGTTIGLPVEQERELLRNFFLHIHEPIPLFREEVFFQAYEQGLVPDGLRLTMLTMSAKLVGKCGEWEDAQLEATIKDLLDDNITYLVDDRLSLDDFRQACLLAYFAFHQYSRERAWQRIGQLARKAYQCGLHQIDNPAISTTVSANCWTQEELDEWRYVWWCIFCLDSVSNAVAATPYCIESEGTRTALPRSPLARSLDPLVDNVPLIFLPAETSEMWETTKMIMETSKNRTFDMYILTTLLIRETHSLRRLRTYIPSPRLKARQAALYGHIKAICSALPPSYRMPDRNGAANETALEHHERLVSLVHLEVARMNNLLPVSLLVDGEREWLDSWILNLEHCESLATVASHFDVRQVCNVNPAICFILMVTLMLLHCHKLCGMHEQPDLAWRVDSHQNALMQLMQQFAKTWELPGILIGKCCWVTARLNTVPF